MMRQQEAKRPDQMRRGVQQNRAFAKRVRNEPEMIALEISEPAMDELGRCRGRRAGEIALPEETDRKPAPGGVACKAAAVDAPADDRDIVDRFRQCCPRPESGVLSEA
jgi:hypothetical protein